MSFLRCPESWENVYISESELIILRHIIAKAISLESELDIFFAKGWPGFGAHLCIRFIEPHQCWSQREESARRTAYYGSISKLYFIYFSFLIVSENYRNVQLYQLKNNDIVLRGNAKRIE